jgi:hypothetical protein
MAIGINLGPEPTENEIEVLSSYYNLKRAYEELSERYFDLTSRMTDAELDEVRAREKT